MTTTGRIMTTTTRRPWLIAMVMFLWVATVVVAQAPSQYCPADVPSGACAAASAADDSIDPPPRPLCGVFMAPSTLGNDTNMGIYTGFDLTRGDVVNFPEIVLPLLFREWGQHPMRDGKLWDRYIWEGQLMDIETYDNTNLHNNRAVFVPGVGCTVNSRMELNNIKSTRGSVYDTTGLHRSEDPGAGASSPYHGAETTVTLAHVAAGTELLATYGDYWIPDLPGVQVTTHPLMDEADDFLLEEYIPFVEEQGDSMTADMLEGLWELTTTFPLYSQALTNLPRDVTWQAVYDEYKTNIEPRRQAQVVKPVESNKKLSKKQKRLKKEAAQDDREAASLVRQFLRRQNTRSLDWLYEYGYCQDHLRPGPSEIPQAGMGAFAARDLPQGTIVGYAPLVHVGRQGRQLWTIEYSNVGQIPGVRHQYDLVLNYSFEHANSTLLLTPYGGMVNYINHNGQAPNVRVQWPNKELVAHKPDWLTKDMDFLTYTIEKIGLSFEYVALRDIEEGEEVVMDYGPEWQKAWDEHVANWKPRPYAETYQHSTEFHDQQQQAATAEVTDETEEDGEEVDDEESKPNKKKQVQIPFRTVPEMQRNPYPHNLQYMCRPYFRPLSKDAAVPPTTMPNPLEEFMYTRPSKTLRKSPQRVFCLVAERFEITSPNDDAPSTYSYTVDMKLRAGDDKSWVRVREVPHKDIDLTDMAFTADWHQPNAFRHPIGFPDDIFPESWRNGPPPFKTPQAPESSKKQKKKFKKKAKAAAASAKPASSASAAA